MVLESIVNLNKSLAKPYEMFFVGLLFASLGSVLAIWTFSINPSLVAVFFTTMIGIPIIYRLLKYEENKELHLNSESVILKSHSKPLQMYFYLFIGITFAFILLQLFFPNSSLMTTQINAINQINAEAFSGKLYEVFGSADITGNFLKSDFSTFMKIFSNNIRVMLMSLIFSLVFGVGAFFILVWNGSVLAAAFVSYFNQAISSSGYLMGFANTALRYFVHGIPEITAYLVAGFAGGILSASIINGDYKTKYFDKILYDFTVLISISIGLILFSGALEVYIMPVFF